MPQHGRVTLSQSEKPVKQDRREVMIRSFFRQTHD